MMWFAVEWRLMMETVLEKGRDTENETDHDLRECC